MTPPTPSPLDQAAAFRAAYQRVRAQLAGVIVGQDAIIDGVLTALFVGGHVLLEGVPGLGKTLLIRALSQALALRFSRIQFTPDLMPADITGTTIVTESQGAAAGTAGGGGGGGGASGGAPGSREFRFQPGPVFAQMILADEINRATPKTQSALLEAMQERCVTVAGKTYPLDAPFFVMATQNPIEQEGTYPLPEAQLDRFLFKLLVGYSNRAEMHAILDRTTAGHDPVIAPVLDGPALVQHQRLVRLVKIAPHVQDYAVRCVLATHPDAPGNEYATKSVQQFVRYGASPRAAQALVLAGKVRALMDSRAHVSIDDLRAVLLPALRHRVLLNFEGQAEGLTPDAILEDIAAHLPVEAEEKTG